MFIAVEDCSRIEIPCIYRVFRIGITEFHKSLWYWLFDKRACQFNELFANKQSHYQTCDTRKLEIALETPPIKSGHNFTFFRIKDTMLLLVWLFHYSCEIVVVSAWISGIFFSGKSFPQIAYCGRLFIWPWQFQASYRLITQAILTAIESEHIYSFFWLNLTPADLIDGFWWNFTFFCRGIKWTENWTEKNEEE